MQPTWYRYEFEDSAFMSDVEASLHLAILAAEGLFGESNVRMDCAYSIDVRRRVCVVDASSEVGRSICQMFTGYMSRELGGDGFKVRPVNKPQVSQTTGNEVAS